MRNENWHLRHRGERGVTLFLLGLSLAALLGVMALAIDLGILYVARGEAQRTADAAALAGADVFYTEGCVTGSGGCVPGGVQEGLAATQAITVTSHNEVAGKQASINCPAYSAATPDPSLGCPGISFSYPTATEPQITVTVARTDVPTIFARMFGVRLASVSATATAEAYSPTGGQSPTSPTCVAPFLVPNCDTNNTTPGNPTCPLDSSGVRPGYFANPNTKPVTLDYSAEGTPWTLHFGSATGSDAATPSEWYIVATWPSGTPSAQQMEQAIEQCMPVTCNQPLPAVEGKKVGPLDAGLEAKINANGMSTGCPANCNFSQGQDTIQLNPGQQPPYQIYAGTNNPLVQSGVVNAGDPIGLNQSPSVTTVALYDGAICGTVEPDGTVETQSNSDCIGPGGGTVTVVGWMTIFLQGVAHVNTYDGAQSIILSIEDCGSDNGSSQPPIVASGASAVPIRLIQHPDSTP